MGNLLSYSLQASIFMVLLYLGYKWLMASTTFHRTNRVTLLLIILISWLAPALSSLFTPRPAIDIELGIPVAVVEGAPSATPAPFLSWETVAMYLYIIGMAIAAIVAIFGALRVWKIIGNGTHRRLGRYILVVNADAPGPFSWGRYIVIRPQDDDESLEMVLNHERAHLDLRHWIDLLLAQITIILQWYNPAAYLVMREMKHVHEYQADSIAGAADPYHYQIMLLKKTVGTSFPTFADSLNHSQIKQRLTMMMQNETKAWRRLSALAIPAMTMAALSVMSIPSVASVIDSIRHTATSPDSSDKVTNSTVINQIHSLDADAESPEEIIPAVTESASDADGMTGTESLIDEIAVTSDQNGEKQKSEKFNPAYFVDGKLFTGSLNDLDPSTIRAMTVVKNDPAYPQGKIMIELQKPGDTRPAQTLADFKGGQSQLMEFLKQNLKYPEGVALDKTTRVIVKFVIGADGSLSDATIVKAAPQQPLNDEALRVVNVMNGHWNPAVDNGKPVATLFTIPVTFKPQKAE